MCVMENLFTLFIKLFISVKFRRSEDPKMTLRRLPRGTYCTIPFSRPCLLPMLLFLLLTHCNYAADTTAAAHLAETSDPFASLVLDLVIRAAGLEHHTVYSSPGKTYTVQEAFADLGITHVSQISLLSNDDYAEFLGVSTDAAETLIQMAQLAAEHAESSKHDVLLNNHDFPARGRGSHYGRSAFTGKHKATPLADTSAAGYGPTQTKHHHHHQQEAEEVRGEAEGKELGWTPEHTALLNRLVHFYATRRPEQQTHIGFLRKLTRKYIRNGREADLFKKLNAKYPPINQHEHKDQAANTASAAISDTMIVALQAGGCFGATLLLLLTANPTLPTSPDAEEFTTRPLRFTSRHLLAGGFAHLLFRGVDFLQVGPTFAGWVCHVLLHQQPGTEDAAIGPWLALVFTFVILVCPQWVPAMLLLGEVLSWLIMLVLPERVGSSIRGALASWLLDHQDERALAHAEIQRILKSARNLQMCLRWACLLPWNLPGLLPAGVSPSVRMLIADTYGGAVTGVLVSGLFGHEAAVFVASVGCAFGIWRLTRPTVHESVEIAAAFTAHKWQLHKLTQLGRHKKLNEQETTTPATLPNTTSATSPTNVPQAGPMVSPLQLSPEQRRLKKGLKSVSSLGSPRGRAQRRRLGSLNL